MNSVVRWGRNGLIVGAILGLIGTIGGNGIGSIFSINRNIKRLLP